MVAFFRIACLLCAAVVSIFSTEEIIAKTLGMKELESLVGNGQFKEALDRGGEVLPSERNESWKKLLGESFGKYTEKKLSANKDAKTIGELIAYIESYSFLEESPALDSIAKSSLAGLKSCLAYGYWEGCAKDAKSLASFRGVSSPLLGRMAEGIAGSSYPGEARPVFKMAFERGVGKGKCGENSIEISMRFGGRDPKGKNFDDFKALAFIHCPERMTKDLIGDITKNDEQKKALCPDLLKYKKVSGVMKSKCERMVK